MANTETPREPRHQTLRGSGFSITHPKKQSSSSLNAMARHQPEINISPRAEPWVPCGRPGDGAPSLRWDSGPSLPFPGTVSPGHRHWAVPPTLRQRARAPLGKAAPGPQSRQGLSCLDNLLPPIRHSVPGHWSCGRVVALLGLRPQSKKTGGAPGCRLPSGSQVPRGGGRGRGGRHPEFWFKSVWTSRTGFSKGP